MSLEKQIEDNTKAVQALTEIMTRVVAGQEALIGAAKTAVADKGGKTTSTKADDKPKTEEKPAETKTEATDGGSALTIDDVLNAVREYAVPIPDDADAATKTKLTKEKEARKVKLAELRAKVGAAQTKDVPPAKFKAFIKAVNSLVAAGNVLPDEPDTETTTDEDDDL